jgi:hypothetical protein
MSDNFMLKQNYQNIILVADTPHETVGVYPRSGLTRVVIWRGFGDLRHTHVTPVKLKIHSYQNINHGPWILLTENERIQGCVVVGDGVYGVLINAEPRVIRVNCRHLPKV